MLWCLKVTIIEDQRNDIAPLSNMCKVIYAIKRLFFFINLYLYLFFLISGANGFIAESVGRLLSFDGISCMKLLRADASSRGEKRIPNQMKVRVKKKGEIFLL